MLVASLLPLPFVLGFIPIVRFESEEISIEVHPAAINVQCDYHYRNPFPFPVQQGFTFPIPIDKYHPDPEPSRLAIREPMSP